MKLHINLFLLAALTSSIACADNLEVITEQHISKVHDASNTTGGDALGAEKNQDASGVVSITHTVKEGANISILCGGIDISSTHGGKGEGNDEPLKASPTDTISGGVVINMEGGKVVQIVGGNKISEGGETAAKYLGDKVNVGSVQINITGGTIGKPNSGEEAIIGGGGRFCGTTDEKGIEVNISGENTVIHNEVYAGTNGGTTARTSLNISGGTINGNVYGGGRKPFGVISGDTHVVLSGGTITGNVYGSGDEDTVQGSTNVSIEGDVTLDGFISGGGTKGSTVKNGRNLLVSADCDLTITEFDTLTVEAGSDVSLASLNDEPLQLERIILASDYGSTDALTLDLSSISTDSLTFMVMLDDADLGTEINHTLTLNLEGLDLNNIETTNVVFVNAEGEEIYYQNASFTTGENGSVTITGSAVVPEPSTVTLSLLALAGIVSRRRRK